MRNYLLATALIFSALMLASCGGMFEGTAHDCVWDKSGPYGYWDCSGDKNDPTLKRSF